MSEILLHQKVQPNAITSFLFCALHIGEVPGPVN